jgi:hypothetical protein
MAALTMKGGRMARKKPPDEMLANAAHDMEIQSLRRAVRDADLKYREALKLVKEKDDELSAILDIQDALSDITPTVIRRRDDAKIGEATAVMIASDWHIEERVDPKTVNGLNRYTPSIAQKRIDKFFAGALSLVEMARSKSTIETCVLAVLGDLITGMIHEDLAENNYLSPTEAVLLACEMLCGGIDFLLEHGGFKRLIVPCNFGNHGRTTKKMRVATAAKQSYEWLLYKFAAKRYAKDSRVQFAIADGYFVWVEVYGIKLRCHHGDNVQYQGGVGGLTIPLNKAIAQWNKSKKADIDILGHWHQRLSHGDFTVNGSAIGYGAYSIKIKAPYEPPQQSFFLLHPKYGKTVECPVLLD